MLFVSVVARAAPAGPLAVTRICTERIGREPSRCLTYRTAFFRGGRLYALTRFYRVKEMGGVAHDWYFKNKLIFEKKLKPTNIGWRAETNISIARRNGKWRFEIVDASGALIQSIEFVIARSKHGYRGRILSVITPSLAKPYEDDNESAPKNAHANAPLNLRTSAPEKSPAKVQAMAKPTPVITTEPLTVPATSPINPPEPSKEFSTQSSKGDWSSSAGFGLDFAKLSSTEISNSSRSTLYSQPLPEALFDMSYEWPNQKMQTTLLAQIESNSYQSVDNKTYEGMPSSLSGVGVEQEFQNTWKNVSPFAGLDMQQDFFDVATSSTNLKYDTIFLPQFFFGLNWDLGQFKKLHNYLSATGIYDFAQSTSDYNVDGSWGWRVDWQPEYNLPTPGRRLAFDLGYESLDEKTTLIERTRQDLDMQVLYGWSY